MKVDMEYVRERLENENVVIIDSREYKRYIGEFEPVDKRLDIYLVLLIISGWIYLKKMMINYT